MPDTAELSATEILIGRAFSRRSEIAKLEAEQAKDEAVIIALGAGKHRGADPAHVVTVVAAVPGSAGKVFYAFPDDADKARTAEEYARKLAGDDATFRKLFTRVYRYEPVEGFAAAAHALLTATAAKEPSKRETDLLALLAQPGRGYAGKKAHILWPKQ